MFKKVLVANRSEIAVRIIRALREMGITSVAVFSEADRHALHTELADEAICIGPAKGIDSYANPVAILSAAMVTGADAIHPGYGFLSERHDFVALCEEMEIKFIGPSSQIIRHMGNKQNARNTMREAGVPTIPGSSDLISSVEEAASVAEEVGYPIMIKAADGGGGKGMRRVEGPDDLENMYKQALAETQSIYGNNHLYVEKIIDPAKHIEVQILADEHGQVVHLGERDCSIQRKNQKVIEFAPALSLPESVRQDLCQTAVKACEAINYTNAGTIEFLVDQDNQFYFMEMNTRLQVEHPVSEMVTGIDIVKTQIEIAAGLPLGFKQEDIEIKGVAIEARLNAENPYKNFQPSSGFVDRLILPGGGMGLRVESSLYPQYTLPPFYDSMVAKVIVHRETREEAFTLMKRALYEVVVDGLDTNINLLDALLNHEDVFQDKTYTNWLDRVFMPDFTADSIEDQQ